MRGKVSGELKGKARWRQGPSGAVVGHEKAARGERAAEGKKRWRAAYWPSTHEKMSGATMVASLSTMNFGVVAASLPQVIFSLGTAPE